ncbi:MAG: motif [Pseudomonadota bacterium]|jgi:hypothetical protein
MLKLAIKGAVALAVCGFMSAASAQSVAVFPPKLGMLTPGDYSFSLPIDQGEWSQWSFVVAVDSQVTAQFQGLEGGAAILASRSFSEATGKVTVTPLAQIMTFEGEPFSLGTIKGSQGTASISPVSYLLMLSSQASQAGLAAGQMTLNLKVTAVPEPGTWALMGLGLVGLAFARRRVA